MKKTAEDVKKDLEKAMTYAQDDATKAIAAGVLSLMIDMKTLGYRIIAIQEKLEK